MKKIALISTMIVGALIMVACNVDEVAKLYEVQVEVIYPEGYEFDTRAGIPVSLTNMITGVVVSAETNDQGGVLFNVEIGSYNITSSFETEEFAFNGILESQSVNEDGQLFQVVLNAMAKSGGLVFSELYFVGSDTPEGTNYANDRYVEIYNNSDEVIYIDGLCIGRHAQNGLNPSQWIDEEGNLLNLIPITHGAFMFPGTGETYPVQPRTAIVMAAVAMNHQADSLNPNSPVDLSNADFETHLGQELSPPDNVNVPNMTQMYTTSPLMHTWGMDFRGVAMTIWRLPTGLDYELFVGDPSNFMVNPVTGRGAAMFMVHVDWVVDAVDVVPPDEDRRYKQLPAVVDAGMVWNHMGRGHSVRRRVEKVIDGKAFLRNTNNSTEDWIGGVIPVPGQVPNVVD
jgi:hypothetical protein